MGTDQLALDKYLQNLGGGKGLLPGWKHPLGGSPKDKESIPNSGNVGCLSYKYVFHACDTLEPLAADAPGWRAGWGAPREEEEV